MGKNGTQSAALGNPVVQELQKETAQRRAQTIAQIASGKSKGETPRVSAETQAEIYCADIASDSDLEKIGTLESKGVTVTQYMEFKQATGGIEADRDANGKTISGSKKEKVLDAIDDMDLTVEQKDTLYEAAGYSKSTLYSSAPWYDIRPNPTREVAKSARKSGTKTSDPLAKWSMDRYKLEPW